MKSLFEYDDYKEFLNEKLDNLDEGGRGSRARMSRSVGCHTAYTAQVLRGASHFSLEQGEAINDFLGHTEEEGHFFLLLLQFSKAGSSKLQSRFRKQIEEMKQGRKLLKNRIDSKEELAERQQIVYYSSWIYGAVHALSSVTGFQSPQKISERLGITVRQAAEALELLITLGILERNQKGTLNLGKAQLHLGADSPLISKHHLNWRLRAMHAIERDPKAGLHYSSVISLSKKDSEIIHEKLIQYIGEIKPIIRDSKEEEVFSLNFDFFSL